MRNNYKISRNLLASILISFTIITISGPATAAAPKCKAGFKAGKTPISLVTGDKVGCVDPAQVTLGKKLITGTSKACFACHSATAQYPQTQMLSNLKAQGFTLKPADITSAFNTHADVMLGSTITAKDAKSISQYLQTIKAN